MATSACPQCEGTSCVCEYASWPLADLERLHASLGQLLKGRQETQRQHNVLEKARRPDADNLLRLALDIDNLVTVYPAFRQSVVFEDGQARPQEGSTTDASSFQSMALEVFRELADWDYHRVPKEYQDDFLHTLYYAYYMRLIPLEPPRPKFTDQPSVYRRLDDLVASLADYANAIRVSGTLAAFPAQPSGSA